MFLREIEEKLKEVLAVLDICRFGGFLYPKTKLLPCTTLAWNRNPQQRFPPNSVHSKSFCTVWRCSHFASRSSHNYWKMAEFGSKLDDIWPIWALMPLFLASISELLCLIWIFTGIGVFRLILFRRNPNVQLRATSNVMGMKLEYVRSLIIQVKSAGIILDAFILQRY